MTSALLDACRPKFDAFIGPRQMAFTKGHSTMDCIFAMEANTEKVLIGDWDCCMALLSMSRTLDTVYRDKLVEVFQEAVGSEKTTAIMLHFGSTQAKVKINRVNT